MTPPVSCHFFCSIKHLIPKVSEALQSSWGASFFYHVFLFHVVQTPKGRRSSGFFWQPSFSPVMFAHLEITECFSEATIELFVATGSSGLRPSRDPPSVAKTNHQFFWSNSTTFAELTAYHFSTNLFHIWRVRILFCTKDPRDTGLWSIDS